MENINFKDLTEDELQNYMQEAEKDGEILTEQSRVADDIVDKFNEYGRSLRDQRWDLTGLIGEVVDKKFLSFLEANPTGDERELYKLMLETSSEEMENEIIERIKSEFESAGFNVDMEISGKGSALQLFLTDDLIVYIDTARFLTKGNAHLEATLMFDTVFDVSNWFNYYVAEAIMEFYGFGGYIDKLYLLHYNMAMKDAISSEYLTALWYDYSTDFKSVSSDITRVWSDNMQKLRSIRF